MNGFAASAVQRRGVPLRRSIILTGLLVLTAACGGTDPSCVITTVDVSPGGPRVVEEESVTLSATVNQTNCGAITYTWQSLTPSTASVVGSGTVASVTGVAAGSANIAVEVRDGNVTATGVALVTVTPAPVGTISITPPAATVQSGQTQTLNAEVRSSRNRVLIGRTITWSSSNSAVASVSGNGPLVIVTGVAAGSAIISATSEGRTASAAIQVTPAPPASISVTPGSAQVNVGRTAQVQADVKDANGNVLSNVAVSWTSADPTTVSVSGSGNTATVTGIKAGGPVRISAAAGNVSGSTNVTVVNVPVASVVMQPAALGMNVGGTGSLAARTIDAGGSELFGRSITWSSSNQLVATVNGSGGSATVTAVTAGQATITASSEGQTGSATITVSTIPVAAVTLQVTSNQINVTATTTVTASTTDANGAVLLGRPVSWESSNPAVASVTPTGTTTTVTGISAGTATITATSEGKTAATVITVASVSTVIVAPHKLTLPMVGASTTILAVQLDPTGNNQAGVTFAWSSSNSNIVAVNASGFISATGVGTATITATSNFNISSTMTVEVFNEYDFIPCLINCYSRSKAVETWDQAKTRAARFGGLLASVTNSAENTHLRGLRGGVQVWIGLQDKVTEGRYIFEDDALADVAAPWFAGWDFGQPDPGPNTEDCALMETLGPWHDYPCTYAAKSFMEWGFQNYSNWITTLGSHNGHRYARTAHPMSWPQAAALATMMGGHLVKIDNAEENNFLFNRFGNIDLWIGLNDRAVAGTQRWQDGSLAPFTSWAGAEPNHSASGAAPFILENCAHIWTGFNGSWNDNLCTQTFFAIIEWDTLK